MNFTVAYTTANTDVGVDVSNTLTLFQAVAAVGLPVFIRGADISLRGASPSAYCIRLEWLVQTTSGAMTAATKVKQDRGEDDSPQTACQVKATTEPTASTVIWSCYLHSQSTLFWRPRFPIKIRGSQRVGLRYYSTVAVHTAFTVYLEE